MAQYQVRSGQNIYDIALTLYGSVEGIFPLLANNSWLTIDTQLKYGMVLEYPEDLKINENITIWLQENNIRVKNGDHPLSYFDVEPYIKNHFEQWHKEIVEELSELSPDEQNMFWNTLCHPRMMIRQNGQFSVIRFQLVEGSHLIIDPGNYKEPIIVEGTEVNEIELSYSGSGEHIIMLYGDFAFQLLDFSELSGIYYPLNAVYADKFITSLELDDNNKLIITKE